MFFDFLAKLFRTINVNLLYVRFLPLEKLLKISMWLSGKVYRKWISKPHSQRWVTLMLDRTIKMKVDTSKTMGAAFYWMGFHEMNEWCFLHRYIKPNMVLVDIGANQGEFSLFSAKRLVKGKVLAFEPVSTFYAQLQDNVALNNFTNIQAFSFGLSDLNTQIPVYMGSTGENEGLATIFQTKERNRLVETVQLKIFDEVFKDLAIDRLDFIKIDVEGSELMVLRGSRKTIQQFKPAIMLEVSEDTYKAAGYSFEDIKNFFYELNYSFAVIAKGGKLVTRNTLPSFCNVVFTPKH